MIISGVYCRRTFLTAILKIVSCSGSQYVRHPTSGQFLNCISERDAIIKFLRLLETAKNRTRPSYDGVILASHSIDTVPTFIKIVRRHSFYDKLLQLVSGVISLAKVIRGRDHAPGQDERPLEDDYEAVMGRRMQPGPRQAMSDARARLGADLVTRLVPGEPSYSNLFR